MFVAILPFEALPNGGTRYTVRARHWSKEACEKHAAMGFEKGWVIAFDQFVGEASLRRAISQFLVHYHTERNHQSLGNKIIRPELTQFPSAGDIRCRKRLGGTLRYYYREAA